MLLFAAYGLAYSSGRTVVRVPVTLAIELAGLAALVLFSDGLERRWWRPRRQWLERLAEWSETTQFAKQPGVLDELGPDSAIRIAR